MNGQDQNDSGPLTIALRQYVCEFDPDSGPVDSAPCPQLSEAWNSYVQAFEDLCQVQNIPENDRKPLFLLLAGMKFRSRLDQIMSGSDQRPSLPEIFEAMANYFESKTSVQSLRFEFLYGLSSRPLPGEVPASWVKRLSEKAKECEFEHMTSEEALALVMSKYGKVEAASRKRKAILKNLQAQNKYAKVDNDHYDEESEHHSNPEELLQQVEVDWGEEEQTTDSYGTESISIKNEVMDPFENTEHQQPVISNSRTLTKVSPDEVAVPKGQPCNCPNCQESPTGKALRHKCHIENCGKEYAKTSHLRAHLGSHSAVLPFACQWPGCGKRFYRTDQLTRHERTHTGEKRFVCFVCSRAFSRSDHLNKHAKRHTPEEIQNAASNGMNMAEKPAPWSSGHLPIPPHLLVGHNQPHLMVGDNQ